MDLASPKVWGDEKRFVDLTMAQNRNVIDLEMGLPAYAKGQNAPRMDLVGSNTPAISGGSYFGRQNSLMMVVHALGV
jgi:hypothetical protein